MGSRVHCSFLPVCQGDILLSFASATCSRAHHCQDMSVTYPLLLKYSSWVTKYIFSSPMKTRFWAPRLCFPVICNFNDSDTKITNLENEDDRGRQSFLRRLISNSKDPGKNSKQCLDLKVGDLVRILEENDSGAGEHVVMDTLNESLTDSVKLQVGVRDSFRAGLTKWDCFQVPTSKWSTRTRME